VDQEWAHPEGDREVNPQDERYPGCRWRTTAPRC